MLKNHRLIIFLASALLMAGLAACSATPAPTAPQNTAGMPVSTAIQTVSPADQGSQATALATENPVGSTLAGSSSSGASETTLAEGLANLDSYTSVLKLTINGTKEDGSTTHQEVTITQKSNRSQNASDFSMNTVEDQNPAKLYEVIQINGDSYMLGTDNTGNCLYFGSEDQTNPMGALGFTAEDILGAFEKTDLIAKGEQVNGVSADHYKVDSGFIFGSADLTSGETWINPDGNYIVRYTGAADVKDTVALTSADVISGHVTWEYNLTGANALGEIQVPDACQQAASTLAGVPIPDNASQRSSFGSNISFLSPDSLSAVADFYHQQLAAQGWQTIDDTKSPQLISITGSKDTRTINVMITPGSDNNTSVSISITQ